MSSNICDGASQHMYEITGVVGRGSDYLIVEWMCIDCGQSFTEQKQINEPEELV